MSAITLRAPAPGFVKFWSSVQCQGVYLWGIDYPSTGGSSMTKTVPYSGPILRRRCFSNIEESSPITQPLASRGCDVRPIEIEQVTRMSKTVQVREKSCRWKHLLLGLENIYPSVKRILIEHL